MITVQSLEIVICTHNRVGLLDRVLVSLNCASRPPNVSVTILVVANACSDGTDIFLDGYLRRAATEDLLPLIWVAEPVPGKCIALNRAISILKGEIVAFVDDDHRVDAQFLVAIDRAVTAYPNATIWCGRVWPDWDGSEPKWVHDASRFRIRPLPVPRQDQGDLPRLMPASEGRVPGGGNIILRRTVFDRIGGYAVDLGPVGHNLGGGEDLEFGRRALEAGEVIQYVPDIVQYHVVEPERLRLGYVLRKAYQRNRAHALARRDVRGTPVYLWRKLGKALAQLAISLEPRRARFYLVSIANTLGEMRGLAEFRPNAGPQAMAQPSSAEYDEK